MAIIDNRLLNCDTDQDVTENFNRLLNLIDELDERVETLETPTEEETNEEETTGE